MMRDLRKNVAKELRSLADQVETGIKPIESVDITHNGEQTKINVTASDWIKFPYDWNIMRRFTEVHRKAGAAQVAYSLAFEEAAGTYYFEITSAAKDECFIGKSRSLIEHAFDDVEDHLDGLLSTGEKEPRIRQICSFAVWPTTISEPGIQFRQDTTNDWVKISNPLKVRLHGNRGWVGIEWFAIDNDDKQVTLPDNFRCTVNDRKLLAASYRQNNRGGHGEADWSSKEVKFVDAATLDTVEVDTLNDVVIVDLESVCWVK